MKKYIILILLVIVCGLGFSYYHKQKQDLGERLVQSAYYADLLDVKDLLEQGAPLDYVLAFNDPERDYVQQAFTVLHAAASGGNTKIITYLLKQGLDVNVRTPQGWTPLFVAARDGQTEAAKLLIFKEADLNAQTHTGATALTMVVTQPFPSEKERLDLLEYMLKRGADPKLADQYGHTPLYYAKVKGYTSQVQLLEKYL